MKRQIFFSYAQVNEAFAARLTDDLCAQGADVWLDIRHAEPGRNWTRSIEQALSESHMMIVALSPAALVVAHVAVEWQAYLEAHRPVIPVIVEACDLPGPLRTRRPIDFTRDYQRGFHQISTRLLEYGSRRQRTDPVIWTLAENVHDFRDEQTPPPKDMQDDPVAGGLRSMVDSLRGLLRARRTFDRIG